MPRSYARSTAPAASSSAAAVYRLPMLAAPNEISVSRRPVEPSGRVESGGWVMSFIPYPQPTLSSLPSRKRTAVDRMCDTATTRVPELLAGERGLADARLKERAHADLTVGGAEHVGERLPFDLESSGHVEVDADVDRPLRRGQSDRGAVRKRSGPGDCGRVDVGRGHDPVDQSPRQRFVRPDAPSGEDEFFRSRRPDQARQPLGATATRQHTEQNFRLPQHRVVRAKTDVGGEREFTTATQRRADDGRDYRLGDLRDRG